MVPHSQDSATAAFRDLLLAQVLLSTSKNANAEMLPTLPPSHGNGTAAAHAQTTTLTETLSLIEPLAPLMPSVHQPSAASPRLSMKAKSQCSPVATPPKDRDANAPTQLIQSPRRPFWYAAAAEPTMESVEPSSSLLIHACAMSTEHPALAAFLKL